MVGVSPSAQLAVPFFALIFSFTSRSCSAYHSLFGKGMFSGVVAARDSFPSGSRLPSLESWCLFAKEALPPREA